MTSVAPPLSNRGTLLLIFNSVLTTRINKRSNFHLIRPKHRSQFVCCKAQLVTKALKLSTHLLALTYCSVLHYNQEVSLRLGYSHIP